MSPPVRTVELASDEPARPRARPLLFLVCEAARPSATPARHSLAAADEVALGRGERRRHERGVRGGARRLAIEVPDPSMSSTHARLDGRSRVWHLIDEGSTNGTFVNGERVSSRRLEDGDVIELGRTFFLFRTGVAVYDHDPHDYEPAGAGPMAAMRSLIPEVQRAVNTVAEISTSPAPILIQGETGTGKEVCARAVHAASGRSGAFVPVNCGAIPETLIESELFGSKKGAFSGAVADREGLVAAADGGTLFLDEIGDLPAPAQAALLRVLQEREVTPVGGTRPVPVDFRLVAATHRDLEEMVGRGEFREDLLARIAGFVTELLPLRDRREDLGLLLGGLLPRLFPEGAGDLSLTSSAMRAILRYAWPRNVRELASALQTAAALARGGAIDRSHLPPAVRDGAAALEADRDEEASLSDEQRRRKEELRALLREHGGNISAVARAIGRARSQVQRWIKRYGLEPEDFRS